MQDAVEAGRAAAGKLSDPSLPYGYIAEALRETAEELAALALEDVTVCSLEDALFRLDTILFAADMDILRAPQHRQLFEDILTFKEKLAAAVAFFRTLSQDTAGIFSEAKKGPEFERSEGKIYGDLAVQEGILLFYLKGEIQKLGSAHLDERQKAALNAVCDRMDRAVKMARSLGLGGKECRDAQEVPGTPAPGPASQKAPGTPVPGPAAAGKEASEIAELLRSAYEEMEAEAQRLGVYGGAIRYLAEEVKKPLKYLPVYA